MKNNKTFIFLSFILGFILVFSLAFAQGDNELRDSQSNRLENAPEIINEIVPISIQDFSDSEQGQSVSEDDQTEVDRIRETAREKGMLIRDFVLERQSEMRVKMETERERVRRQLELHREEIKELREDVDILPQPVNDFEALRQRENFVQNFIAERHRIITEKISQYRQQVHQQRQEAVQKAQEKRELLLNRIQKEQDERTKETAQRVTDRLNSVRDRIIENYILNLSKMEIVLVNIATAADKAETREVDVQKTRDAIELAEDEINEARAFLNTLMQESYIPDFEEDDSLGLILQAIRDEMHQDLSQAREAMLKARQAARLAANALADDLAQENN